MIKDKEKFCEELKDFFKSQGITQQEIANRCHTQQQYVNSLLNGKKSFGKKAADLWAETFGLSASWLLTGEGEMLTGTIVQNNQNGDNINGEGFTVNKAELEFMSLLKKKDEQIDRLLTIIEKMQEK